MTAPAPITPLYPLLRCDSCVGTTEHVAQGHVIGTTRMQFRCSQCRAIREIDMPQNTPDQPPIERGPLSEEPVSTERPKPAAPPELPGDDRVQPCNDPQCNISVCIDAREQIAASPELPELPGWERDTTATQPYYVHRATGSRIARTPYGWSRWSGDDFVSFDPPMRTAPEAAAAALGYEIYKFVDWGWRNSVTGDRGFATPQDAALDALRHAARAQSAEQPADAPARPKVRCLGKGRRDVVVGDGFASATPCPACGHTRCGKDCGCRGVVTCPRWEEEGDPDVCDTCRFGPPECPSHGFGFCAADCPAREYAAPAERPVSVSLDDFEQHTDPVTGELLYRQRAPAEREQGALRPGWRLVPESEWPADHRNERHPSCRLLELYEHCSGARVVYATRTINEVPQFSYAVPPDTYWGGYKGDYFDDEPDAAMRRAEQLAESRAASEPASEPASKDGEGAGGDLREALHAAQIFACSATERRLTEPGQVVVPEQQWRELVKACARVNDERKRLEGEVATMRAALAEWTDRCAKLEHVRADRDAKAARAAGLELRLSGCESALADAAERADKRADRIRELEAENAGLERQLKQATTGWNDASAAHADAAEAEEKLEARVRELEAENAELKTLKRCHENELESMHHERWHATYNAALNGLYAIQTDLMTAAFMHARAAEAADIAHGPLAPQEPKGGSDGA